jgi:hypothetical protein
VAVKPQRQLVQCVASPGTGAHDLEVGGLYEADDPAVTVYPAYFLPWPCTVREVTAAAQALHDDYLQSQQNRRDAWAAAERADLEAEALRVAAEAEAKVRVGWSRYMVGQWA